MPAQTDPSVVAERPGPRPFSSGAMRRLGKAMASGQDLDSENKRILEQYLSHYSKLMQFLGLDIIDHLRGTGFPVEVEVTARLKSWPTVIAKIQKGMRFDSIRDLVGVRVVLLAGGRAEQDRAIECLKTSYDGAREIDRRRDPRSGYRAVHLEVNVDGARAEIQIRTGLQHEWAELSEFVADRWGRQLRYDEEPPNFTEEQRGAWATILTVAELIAMAEQQQASKELSRWRRALHPRRARTVAQNVRMLRDLLKQLRVLVDE